MTVVGRNFCKLFNRGLVHSSAGRRKMTSDPKSYFMARDHALEYRQYRRSMPPQIAKKIACFMGKKLYPECCTGVDVGCGSGQSTLPFAERLRRVIGVDTSVAQIIEATKGIPENVEFRIGDAENIPVLTNSVHLVYAMNAAHWFDLEKFYKEADRVLRPNGVLALCTGEHSFEISGCEKESKELFRQFEMTACKKYFNERVLLPDNLYRDFVLPYTDFKRDETVVSFDEMTLGFLMRRLRTISTIRKFLQEEPENAVAALKDLENEFLRIIRSRRSAEQTNIMVCKRYVILMGRKTET